MHNDELCIQFSTIENRKGYGKQYIPVSELEQVMAVLLEAKDNGIQSETEKKSTAQIVKESLVENEEGEIRFKSEETKGKKPTLFTSKDDFNEMNAIYETMFGSHKPARSTIEVSRLPLNALIEIECIASLKKNQS